MNKIENVTKASGNIFTDLGFSEATATALLAEADAEIAQRQALRETLAGALISWIDDEKLRQEDAGLLDDDEEEDDES